MSLSFHTAKRLRALVEILPSGVAWSRVEIDRTLFPSKEPIYLYKHDAIDCIEDLFRNPLFKDHLSFTPTKLFRGAENLVRIYTEWMTGDNAHDFQVCIIFVDRYIHLTRITGSITYWFDRPWYYPIVR